MIRPPCAFSCMILATASMARKRHLHQAPGVFLGFVLFSRHRISRLTQYYNRNYGDGKERVLPKIRQFSWKRRLFRDGNGAQRTEYRKFFCNFAARTLNYKKMTNRGYIPPHTYNQKKRRRKLYSPSFFFLHACKDMPTNWATPQEPILEAHSSVSAQATGKALPSVCPTKNLHCSRGSKLPVSPPSMAPRTLRAALSQHL